MEQSTSSKFKRQRKFFTLLPALVLPFLTLFFWALGGGKGANAVEGQSQKGINTVLPDAFFRDDKDKNKMGYYDEAMKDSLKRNEQHKDDPFYHPDDMSFGSDDTTLLNPTINGNDDMVLNSGSKTYRDPNEEKVFRKLQRLDNALNSATEEVTDQAPRPKASATGGMDKGDIDRLEQMMQVMNNGSMADPEMQQLDGMMEKILDMQHPERVNEKIRQSSIARRGQVFAVSSNNIADPISTLGPKAGLQSLANANNGFYSLNSNEVPVDTQNVIQAVIHGNQTVVNGSTAKLRLSNAIYINGIMIPKGTFIYGVVALNGERLTIQIENIRYQNSLFPVALAVYDLDGLNGIYIPGAITRDVAKQSADRSMQSIGYGSMDASWQGQAVGAGVETVKTLFSKKVKLVKVTIKAEYQVLLFDEKQKLMDNR